MANGTTRHICLAMATTMSSPLAPRPRMHSSASVSALPLFKNRVLAVTPTRCESRSGFASGFVGDVFFG